MKVNYVKDDADLHVRLSPGPSVRSTATIVGCTSNTGKGVSGSISSSASFIVNPPNPNPTGDPNVELGDIGLDGKDALEDGKKAEMREGDRDLWPGDDSCAGEEGDGER